jgi:amidase
MKKIIPKLNLKYEYSRFFNPIMKVKLREDIYIETEDTFNGNLKYSGDIIKLIDSGVLPLSPPLTGPIYIEGSKAGDILEISIDDIKIGNVGGTCFNASGRGVDSWLDSAAYAKVFDSAAYAKVFEISNQKIKFSDKLEIIAEPFIGCISTAPASSSPSSKSAFQSGGNMDCCLIKSGAKVFLPVNIEGAYVYLGDVHALQGDGEFCDSAVEVASQIRLHFDLFTSLSHHELNWPRVETSDILATVVSGYSLEDSFRIAMREMLIWLEVEYNLPQKDIFLELSQVANLRLCNRFTVRCELQKKFLQI